MRSEGALMTHAIPGERAADPRLEVLRGRLVTLRPARPGEPEELARSIAADVEAAPWWSTDPEKNLHWLTDRSAATYVIDVDGAAAGIIMYEEENDPDYKLAGIDITLLAPWIGRGYGHDALVTLARHLFDDRGHHRIQIDPAADNARAIRAYERVGFKPVGIMRQYERTSTGEWRDALLMDMLREDLASE